MTKREDDPYAAGWAAYLRGQKRESNPHEGDDRRLWRKGWEAAEKYEQGRGRSGPCE